MWYNMNKCIDCNLCLDVIWVEPRRFFRCWLCEKLYDKVDGKLVEITDAHILREIQIRVKKVEEN